MSAAKPECPECRMRTSIQRQSPCERCFAAWEWLVNESDRELYGRWRNRVVPALTERLGEEAMELVLPYLTIVSWNENRVLTIAGWRNSRQWFKRRYVDVLKDVVRTDNEPVFMTPRVGATIARRIQREKEE